MKLDGYFKAPTKEGRPRILFTIGIPGSGKSFATSEAEKYGWVKISSDEMRVGRLEQLKLRGESIDIDGQLVEPDSQNPQHVFHQSLRDWVNREVYNRLDEYTDAKKNIVFDITNVSLHRVIYMNLARRKGYFLESFLFQPNTDMFVHLNNIENRVAQGGLDLSASCSNPRQNRLAVIRSVMKTYQCFSPSMKQDRYYFKGDDHLDIDFPWEKMKSTPNDYQMFLNQLSSEDRAQVQRLASKDIFNEIHMLSVKDHSH